MAELMFEIIDASMGWQQGTHQDLEWIPYVVGGIAEMRRCIGVSRFT